MSIINNEFLTRNKAIGAAFDRISADYDAIHYNAIDGGPESKLHTVKFIPPTAKKILNLGAGTGEELEHIFARNKNAQVDCVDISPKMLDILKERFSHENINAICQDYFERDYEKEAYDCVVSIMSLHHFLPEQKEWLYRKIYETLVAKGTFVYGDLFARNFKEERQQAAKYNNDAKFDTQTLPSTDIKLLKRVGFERAHLMWKFGNTGCIVAGK